MKNNDKIFITIALLGILFSNVVFSSLEKESINRLFNISGLTKIVEQIPDLISSGFIEGFTEDMTITEKEKMSLLDIINQSFSPSKFHNQFQMSIEKDINKNDIITLLNWYESELGILITKAEENSTTDKAYNEIMKNAILLMKDTKRLEMAKRIDKLLDETNKMMSLQKKIGISIYTGLISSLDPEDISSSLVEFESEFAETEFMLKAELQQMIYASFIYSYKDISDSDLDKYELFLMTDAYQKYNLAITNGLEKGFDETIPDFTKKLSLTILEIINRLDSEDSK